MIILRNVIADELNNLAKDFIDKYDELGMRASGEWADAVEVQADNLSGKILGIDYTDQLVQGRAPGSMPPVSPIEDWVKSKFGLSGREATGAAWAIATKIKNEGTTWYKSGGSDLVDGVLTQERQSQISQKVGLDLTVTIREQLIRELRKSAA